MKTKNKSKTIEKYLKDWFVNKGSIKAVRWCLWKYFEFIENHPDGYFKKYNEKQLKEHLLTFMIKIEDLPPRTQTNLFSSVKKYFKLNDAKIKESYWEELKQRNKLKKARSITKKATPTLSDLKKIFSYANLKQKTLFMFCATTGLRIGEAVQLIFADIDLDKRYVHIRPEVGKGNYERFTFFTPEMKELFQEWKKARLKLLQGKHIKSLYVREMLENKGYTIKMEKERQEKNKDGALVWIYRYIVLKDGKQLSKEELLNLDNRVFPFSKTNAETMWINLIEKVGEPFNIRDTNPKFKKPRYLYNQHCLRRFWYTQLSSSRINTEYRDFIGGHMSQLDSSYIRFLDNVMWIDKIKQEYDEHMKCLLIYETSPDLTDIHDQLSEKDKQIQELNETLKIMELRMQGLENKLEIEKIKNGKK